MKLLYTVNYQKMMKTKLNIRALLYILLISTGTFAQSIGINNPTPHASAALDVVSTSQGILVPRMLESERTIISSPATGLLVYQTDAQSGFYFFNGTAWKPLSENGWGITGNAGTDGGTTNFIGTTDAKDFVIKTGTGKNQLAKFSGDANYNVSFGTSNASGTFSTAMGNTASATNNSSTAIGNNTLASAFSSTAMGNSTTASGHASTAIGQSNVASGQVSIAMGSNTTASGNNSTAMGQSTNASADGSTAIGYNSAASGSYSTAIGYESMASKRYATALGKTTKASGENSMAMGYNTTASGDYSTAIGNTTTASGLHSTAMGYGTSASADYSTAMGYNSIASQQFATSMGFLTKASGQNSTAMGQSTTASGLASTAMGNGTSATGLFSTALGFNSIASQQASFAVGNGTTASGISSVAMGNTTTASGSSSTAMGNNTKASGFNSTALGQNTTASSSEATAMGQNTIASGSSATAIGENTLALSYAETAIGILNTSYTPLSTDNWRATDRLFVIGNGEYDDGDIDRSDAMVVLKNGKTGIGISIPTEKLDIAGSIKIVDGTQGVGKVLTSDSNGKASWQAASGGGAGFFKVNPTNSNEIIYDSNTNYGKAFIINADSVNYKNSSNSKMMYIPSKSAFRVGAVFTKNWDLDSLGEYSFASGIDTKALYDYSTAMGYATTASARSSTALGDETIASGDASTALGRLTNASGHYSIAMGERTNSIGENSTAMGYFTNALGAYSTAIGFSTSAEGDNSIAMGDMTSAKSYDEVALGAYNTSYTAASATEFNAADRAFGVGIGTDIESKDGLIVYKTGNTFISNVGNTPTDGNTTILPGYGSAALQVRASSDGFNLRTGTSSNSMNLAKEGIPSNGNRYISFGHMNTGSFTEIGRIEAASAGAGVAYSTTSDMRLKNDNGLYLSGLSTIKNIKIHNYTWKESTSKDVGVFAQELFKIYPTAVSVGDEADESDPSKIEKRWQVDYSKLVPVLVAATQELSTKNELLEQKVASLELQNVSLATQISELANLKSDIEALKASLNPKATAYNK